MEDPAGIHGKGEPDDASNEWVNSDDVYDLQHKLREANIRDDKLARLLIDGHVYKEDVDEEVEDEICMVESSDTSKSELSQES